MCEGSEWAVVEGRANVVIALRPVRWFISTSLHDLWSQVCQLAYEADEQGLTSISPLAGHCPYACDSGNIQIAGQSQSLQVIESITLSYTVDNLNSPLRQLCSNFYLAKSNGLLAEGVDPRALYGVDNCVTLTIAGRAASCLVVSCASLQCVVCTIQHFAGADLVGSQCGDDVEIGIRGIEVVR